MPVAEHTNPALEFALRVAAGASPGTYLGRAIMDQVGQIGWAPGRRLERAQQSGDADDNRAA